MPTNTTYGELTQFLQPAKNEPCLQFCWQSRQTHFELSDFIHGPFLNRHVSSLSFLISLSNNFTGEL